MDGRALLDLIPSPTLCRHETLSLLGLSATTCLLLALYKFFPGQLNNKATSCTSDLPNRVSKFDDHTASTGAVTKELDFPDGWWSSEDVLSLERRAIFSNTPIAIAHMRMFRAPGTYHTLDHPAGYPLFLILGRDRVLRGFHNVCRHRAYPVVSTKKTGCAFVLGCHYHGWSYDAKGNLVKAPKFDHLEGFDKKANSLLAVNVVVAASGVVFVDAGTLPNNNVSTKKNESSKYAAQTWEMEGDFNWKLAESADAFSLPLLDNTVGATTPPLASLTTRFTSSNRTRRMKPSILTTIIDTPEHKLTTTIQVYPVSAEKTRINISLYASSSSASPSQAFVKKINNDFRQAISRLENTHSRVKDTSSISNEPHLVALSDSLKSHQRLERAAGRQIWPASELFDQSKDSNADLSAAEKLFLELKSVGETYGGNARKEPSRSSIAW